MPSKPVIYRVNTSFCFFVFPHNVTSCSPLCWPFPERKWYLFSCCLKKNWITRRKREREVCSSLPECIKKWAFLVFRCVHVPVPSCPNEMTVRLEREGWSASRTRSSSIYFHIHVWMRSAFVIMGWYDPDVCCDVSCPRCFAEYCVAGLVRNQWSMESIHIIWNDRHNQRNHHLPSRQTSVNAWVIPVGHSFP